MKFIALFQIYSPFWYSILIFLFSGIIEYKRFVFLVALISSSAMLKTLLTKKRIAIVTFVIFGVLVLISVLYLLTGIRYGDNSDFHKSYFLVLLAQTIPGMLFASFMANEECFSWSMAKLLPFVTVIFSAISIYTVIFPSYYNSGGVIMSDYGLNYQNTSYLAAYASNYALVLFDGLISDCYDEHKINKVFYAFILILNFFTSLAAGGRGGLVTYVVVNAFLIFVIFKNRDYSYREMANRLLRFLVIILALYFVIRFAASSVLGERGYRRIIGFFLSGESGGRDKIYKSAIECFLKSPIIGHGLGSVFYELSFYAHNLFLDSLIETGLIGTSFFLFLNIKTFFDGWYLYKTDRISIIWLIVFLQGFVGALFSGYYLVNILVCWPMAFIITKRKLYYC